MGSITLARIAFRAYSLDHELPHVHAIFAKGKVIIDLVGGSANLRVIRATVRTSDVRKALRVADDNFAEWNRMHQ